jgi:hypothetical protein
MKIIERDQIKDLTHDELVEALTFTNLPTDYNTAIYNAIYKYYDLLPETELAQKAYEAEVLGMEHKGPKISELEMKRRAYKESQRLTKSHRIVIKQTIDIKRVPKSRAIDLLIAEFMRHDSILDVSEICNGVVGVKLNLFSDRDKAIQLVERAVAACGYEGEVVYAL